MVQGGLGCAPSARAGQVRGCHAARPPWTRRGPQAGLPCARQHALPGRARGAPARGAYALFLRGRRPGCAAARGQRYPVYGRSTGRARRGRILHLCVHAGSQGAHAAHAAHAARAVAHVGGVVSRRGCMRGHAARSSDAAEGIERQRGARSNCRGGATASASAGSRQRAERLGWRAQRWREASKQSWSCPLRALPAGCGSQRRARRTLATYPAGGCALLAAAAGCCAGG